MQGQSFKTLHHIGYDYINAQASKQKFRKRKDKVPVMGPINVPMRTVVCGSGPA